MLTIVTGWSPKGYHVYGRNFLDTFARYASSRIRLLVYVEDLSIDPGPAELVSLWDTRGCREFIERHKGNKEANGKVARGKFTAADVASGWYWRNDAVRFCRQGFIPEHAASLCDTEFLAWFDGDVIFTRAFKPHNVTDLIPKEASIAYLGRPPSHSEIGFQLYRLPQALPHLSLFAEFYRSDDVFKLHEWHSAFVFDRARERSGVPSHNVTPGGRSNVWLKSPLQAFSTHLKGKAKYNHAGAGK